jgi:ankyrin repeat protein
MGNKKSKPDLARVSSLGSVNSENINQAISAYKDGKWTPLMIACDSGDLAETSRMLKFGADVNLARKSSGATPLYIACLGDFDKVVELLLKNKADPNKARKMGQTPLYACAEKGLLPSAATLLEYGAVVDQCSKDGNQPLHVAIRGSHAAMCAMLLEHGADPNAKNSVNGTTALAMAAYLGRLEIVNLLLSWGADVHERTDNKLPSEWAREREHEFVAQKIEVIEENEAERPPRPVFDFPVVFFRRARMLILLEARNGMLRRRRPSTSISLKSSDTSDMKQPMVVPFSESASGNLAVPVSVSRESSDIPDNEGSIARAARNALFDVNVLRVVYQFAFGVARDKNFS